MKARNAADGAAAWPTMSASRPSLSWSLAVVLSGVIAGCGAPSVAVDPVLIVESLLAAEPGVWLQRLEPVHRCGKAAVEPLLAALRANPHAAGAPAAVALLGRLHDDRAIAWLAGEVAARSALATEAALALGELPAPAQRAELRACVADPIADATLRTAAAIACVRLGGGADVAPFLAAVLLAGSPAGVEPGRTHGLPVRTRWALERYMVQRLLLQEGQAELAQALDPDASWPRLAEVTARVVAWLGTR